METRIQKNCGVSMRFEFFWDLSTMR